MNILSNVHIQQINLIHVRIGFNVHINSNIDKVKRRLKKQAGSNHMRNDENKIREKRDERYFVFQPDFVVDFMEGALSNISPSGKKIIDDVSRLTS